jgi:hypothetical protein
MGPANFRPVAVCQRFEVPITPDATLMRTKRSAWHPQSSVKPAIFAASARDLLSSTIGRMAIHTPLNGLPAAHAARLEADRNG